MDFIEKKHKESEQIEEEPVTLNSKTSCLLEASELINEISVNLPSQFLIAKITTSFEQNFYQLIINNRFEAEKFEPDPTFENTINDINNNHLKIIASTSTNSSAIISFEEKFDPLCIKNIFEAKQFEPEPTFENTINEIKYKHLKSIVSTVTNSSDIT